MPQSSVSVEFVNCMHSNQYFDCFDKCAKNCPLISYEINPERKPLINFNLSLKALILYDVTLALLAVIALDQVVI